MNDKILEIEEKGDFTISNIESVKKNAKTYNDNTGAFVDLNRKIMHYWLSAFSPKRN